MKALASLILVLYLLKVKIVHSQTVSVTINDSVEPVDNGETQTAKTVTITCSYEALTSRSWVTRFEFRDSDTSQWDVVYVPGQVSQEWDSDSYAVTTDVDDTTNSESMIFTIKSAVLRNAGAYRCAVVRVENGKNTLVTNADTSLEIFANTEQVIVDGAEGNILKVTADQDEVVKCIAMNGSFPKMQLKIGGQVVEDNLIVEDLGYGTYVAEPTVRFLPEHNGERMYCISIVPTYENSPAEAFATLQVTAKPVITCDSETESKPIGSDAVFTCTITGSPLPTESDIEWAWNEHRLTGNGKNDFEGVSSEVTVNSDNVKVVLTVTVMETNIDTVFTISVNYAGGDNPYKVLQLEKPPKADASGGDGENSGECIRSFGPTLLFLLTAVLLL